MRELGQGGPRGHGVACVPLEDLNLRTLVTFQSMAFNTTERRPNFINDGCYGDDLARWLLTDLQAAGVATDAEPGQEDFGWYLTFRPAEAEHQFVISYRPEPEGEPGTWIGVVERKAGFLQSLFGARDRGIEMGALLVLHRLLTSSDRVSNVRWHHKAEFAAGNEAAGRLQPDAA